MERMEVIMNPSVLFPEYADVKMWRHMPMPVRCSSIINCLHRHPATSFGDVGQVQMADHVWYEDGDHLIVLAGKCTCGVVYWDCNDLPRLIAACERRMRRSPNVIDKAISKLAGEPNHPMCRCTIDETKRATNPLKASYETFKMLTALDDFFDHADWIPSVIKDDARPDDLADDMPTPEYVEKSDAGDTRQE